MEAVSTGASTVHIEPSEHDWQVRLRRSSGLSSRRVCHSTGLGHRLSWLAKRAPRLELSNGNGRIEVSVAQVQTFHGMSWLIKIRVTPRLPPTLDELLAHTVSRQRLRQVLAARSGVIVLASGNPHNTRQLRAAIAQECIAPDRRVVCLEESAAGHPSGSIACVLTPELRQGLSSIAKLDADVLIIGDIDVELADVSNLIKQASRSSLVVIQCESSDIGASLNLMRELDSDQKWIAHRTVAIVQHEELSLLCSSCRTAKPRTPPIALVDANQLMEALMNPAFEASGCELCHFSGIGGVEQTADVLLLDDMLCEELRQGQRSLVRQHLEAQSVIPAIVSRSVRAGRIGSDEAHRIARRYSQERQDEG